MMNLTETIINTLKENDLSHNLWENYGKTRIYLNISDFAKLINFSYNLYKTGNISKASLDGEEISNRLGKEIYEDLKDLELYVDLKEGNYQIIGKSLRHGGLTDWQYQVVDNLDDKLTEVIFNEK